MAISTRVERADILARARTHDWKCEALVVDDGNIIRDLFTCELGTVRVVWLCTPWSNSGRFAGAVFSDRNNQIDRNIWTLGGRNSLLGLLSSHTAPPTHIEKAPTLHSTYSAASKAV